MVSAYDLLDARSNADEAPIKAAFRKAVKRVDPDLNPNNSEADERFRQPLSARADIAKACQHSRMRGRQGSWEILVAVSMFVAASSMSLALLISLGQVPPIAFQMRMVQIGEWSTVVQDEGEVPAPKQ
jgi:hypothetical protein